MILLILYVLSHGPLGDMAVEYQGMTEETITSMETARGNTVEIISQDKYNQFIQAHHASERGPDIKKKNAKDVLSNKKSTDKEKINAIIELLDLNI